MPRPDCIARLFAYVSFSILISTHATSMLSQILAALRGRTLQAYQITGWCRPRLSKIEVQDCDAIRQICTCLFAGLEAAIEDLPPQETGTLYSVLRKCVMALTMFVANSTTNDEVNAAILELETWIKHRCPNTDICTLSLIMLAVFTSMAMRQECEESPEYAAALAAIRSPRHTYQQMRKAFRMNYKITMRISCTIFQATLPQLHEKYSLQEMICFIRAYRQEDTIMDDGLPFPSASPVQFIVDDTEVEYQPCGKRIEVSTFCEPAGRSSSGAECPICMSTIDARTQGRPMVTKCRHIYHELCLDKWVNDSSMKTSNLCPACRTLLCEPRGRVHNSIADLNTADVTHGEDEPMSGSPRVESMVAVRPRLRMRWLSARTVNSLNVDSIPTAERISPDIDSSQSPSGTGPDATLLQ